MLQLILTRANRRAKGRKDDGRSGEQCRSSVVPRTPSLVIRPSAFSAISWVNRRAFSLVELVLIVVILGVFAAVAVPRLDYAIVRRYKAEATARRIVIDLRRVRGLATLNAATNSVGYSMDMNGPTGDGMRTSYQIRNLDTAAVLDEHSFDPDVTVWSDKEGIRFGPLGNLIQAGSGGYPAEIRVSAEGKTFTIGLVTATGAITCAGN